MSLMKITIYPVDSQSHFSLEDCIMSIALLSKEKGLKYRLSANGAVIMGNRKALIEFKEHLKCGFLGKLTDKVVLIAALSKNPVKSSKRTVTGDILSGSNSKEKETLEDLVMEMIG